MVQIFNTKNECLEIWCPSCDEVENVHFDNDEGYVCHECGEWFGEDQVNKQLKQIKLQPPYL